jgi:ABC-type transport system involved in multi-copper enzyme maturation permease subunit
MKNFYRYFLGTLCILTIISSAIELFTIGKLSNDSFVQLFGFWILVALEEINEKLK